MGLEKIDSIEKSCQGSCPVCGSSEQEIGNTKDFGDIISLHFTCSSCGQYYEEDSKIVYTGTYYKPNDKNTSIKPELQNQENSL